MRGFLPVSLSAVLLLTGCTELQLATHFTKEALNTPAPYQAPPVKGPRKTGQPYQIDGMWYHPLVNSDGYRAKGIASWYGKDFHAKKTANGETYNMYDITAAHPTLPLPSYVRVTNLNNGRSLVVRVNDRGPFLRGRIIDLSYRSAQLLGVVEQGTAPVLLEALPSDGSPLLVASNEKDVPFKKYGSPKREEALAASSAAAPRVSSFTNRVSDHNPVITEEDVIPAKPPSPAKIAATDVRIFVQVGSFTNKANAQNQRNALHQLFADTAIEEAAINGRTFYRVRIGPVLNVDMADQILARAIHEGYKQSIIVVD